MAVYLGSEQVAGLFDGIESYNIDAQNGYIRFKNHLQIAWQTKNADIGGTLWDTSTKVWYSDTNMSDWTKPFSNIFLCSSTVKGTQCWSSCDNWSNTNGGAVRCFRPNSVTENKQIGIFAIGTWE